MANCIRNIRTKNYQNLIIVFLSYSRKLVRYFLGHSVQIKNMNLVYIFVFQAAHIFV